MLNSKMLDLGAEYPLFTGNTLGYCSLFALGDLCGRNPDLLEGQHDLSGPLLLYDSG